MRRARVVRPAVVALLTMLTVLLSVSPASAHSVAGAGSTNFRTVLHPSALPPGVRLSVVENGSRLELRNTSPSEVVVQGYTGEPYLRVGPSGVHENRQSPATYLNADRYGRIEVPAGVGARKAPVWRKVSGDPVARWHDHRIHWMSGRLPPAVISAPDSFHRIAAWTVVLEQGGLRTAAEGELHWVPGPSPWPYAAVGVLLFAGTVALTWLRRPLRWLAAAALALAVLDVWHSALISATVAGTSGDKVNTFVTGNWGQLPCWAALVIGGFLLLRSRSDGIWPAATAGPVVASLSGLADIGVLWRSSAPFAGPDWLDRAQVLLISALGFGLLVALPLLLRRELRARRTSEEAGDAPAT
ncbi:hypothetical protein GTW98_20850 [Streptomyces sp. SID8375]|uniref:hypothetical protein n=1 Tax=unclassified Streptomyces TaxID=2593676 RepID=UPI0007C7DCB5|nr:MULTISPECIES: hypothetical protein [unclassified Streptomyces]MYX09216.1 hypothetical protein [Streptomyces sp. SID8375]